MQLARPVRKVGQVVGSLDFTFALAENLRYKIALGHLKTEKISYTKSRQCRMKNNI